MKYPILLTLLAVTLGVLIGFGLMSTPTLHAQPEGTTPGWSYFPVGGLALCTPPDSLGRVNCIPLPPGSVLAVPDSPKKQPDPTRKMTES